MTSKLVQLDLHPNERTLRQFGFIALGGFGLLAACAWFETLMFAFGLGEARAPVAAVLASLGVLGALLSLVHPKANRALYVATAVLAYPFGFLLSYVVMAVLFFGIFAPVGLALRVFGHDPLQREYRSGQKTYFTPAKRARPKASYFRQF